MAKVVVGMFDNMEHARDAVNDLVDSGIDRNSISLIAGDERGELRKYVGPETADDAGTEIAESAAGGAGIGAVLGGLGGLLVGLGALAIPGIGPIIAAGPIVSALTGAGVGAAAGAVTGGLLGALVEMGIPDERARVYQDGIRYGNILVTARVNDDMASTAVDILNRHHPIDVDRKSGEWRQSSTTPTTGTSDYTGTTGMGVGTGTGTASQRTYGMDQGSDMGTTSRDMGVHQDYDVDPTDGDATIPVVEEELRIGKREVDTDRVNVRTHTTETPVEENINLREEHIDIDRRPVDRPATPDDIDRLGDRSFEVRATSEEPVVEKRARVVEEVDIHKDVDERQETIRDNVRRTDVDIDRSGTGAGMGTDYGTGRSYETYYDYGVRLHDDPRYRNRSWDEFESDLRSDWETRYHDTPWEEFKAAVRRGWDSLTGQNNY